MPHQFQPRGSQAAAATLCCGEWNAPCIASLTNVHVTITYQVAALGRRCDMWNAASENRCGLGSLLWGLLVLISMQWPM